MLGKKLNKNLSEKEVTEILINWKGHNGGPDLRHLTNLIGPANLRSNAPYTSYLIKENVLRTELGFNKGSKPGDFDIILIPCRGSQILFDRTAIFEVKVVRPTRSKPSRNANSLGVTQVTGLINDGFPIIGLIHVCMPEPLLEAEKTPVQFAKRPIDVDDPSANKGILDDLGWTTIDMFGNFSSDKQMQRLISLDIPKYVCISAFSLEFYEDGLSIGTCTQDYWSYQKGYFNPHLKTETIERVENYVDKNITAFKEIKL